MEGFLVKTLRFLAIGIATQAMQWAQVVFMPANRGPRGKREAARPESFAMEARLFEL